MFRVVLADPPWQYSDRLRMSDTARSAEDHYRVMSTRDIAALATWREVSVATQLSIMNNDIADDALLYCWVTNPFLLNGDGPAVVRAWGFEPKQLITWVKGRLEIDEGYDDLFYEYHHPKLVLHVGLGRITRGCTEHIIVGTRGKVQPLIRDRSIPNVLVAPRRDHSRKPDEQYALIESITEGPYLELFGRQRRDGWVSVGDELR